MIPELTDLKRPRRWLLEAVRLFVERASRLEGVEWIALMGSLTSQKANPKDADVLVSIRPETDMGKLAAIGRGLKGRCQNVNRGADIFLAQDGRYLGRTCRHREVFHRVACENFGCSSDRPHLCDTSLVFRLADSLVADPPIRLWPEFKASVKAPEDVLEILGSPAERGISPS